MVVGGTGSVIREGDIFFNLGDEILEVPGVSFK